MLSAVPAVCPDGLFGVHFPAFEGSFSPWDCSETLYPLLQPEPTLFPNTPQEPVLSNSGSDTSNPTPLSSNSPPEEPNRDIHNSGSGSGSDEPNREAPVMDERKRRRMISNRESARRSRMRKQKHLENLRNQVNRLKIGNRELVNRLRLVTHLCQLVRGDNERLQSESAVLRHKLWDFHRVLYVRELQQQLGPSAWACNVNPITLIDQQNPS
ncbi:hypothetical protein NMG60_11006008 [Bertholletia excelsa]